MIEEKLSKKKSLKNELTLDMLKEKIHAICYPENDTWFADYVKRTGKEPPSMFCSWHEDEKYYKFKALLNYELEKYPNLRKQFDIEQVEHQLDMEIFGLKFRGMTEEQAQNDARVIALKKKIEKIKAIDYKEEKEM